MAKTFLFSLIFMEVSFFVYGGKILVMQMVPTTSYRNIMSSVVKNLAAEHEIVYYSITDQEFNFPNVTLVNVPNPGYRYSMEQSNIFKNMLIQDDTSKVAASTVMALQSDYVEIFLKSKLFQNLMHTKEKFDALVMVYTLSEFLVPFAHLLNLPLIQVSASIPLPWQNDAIGNPNYFSHDDSLLTTEMPDNFYNRLTKFVKHLKVSFSYKRNYLPSLSEIARKYFSPTMPSIEAISKNTTSLLLVNTVEAMGYSKPVLSNYVEIGGLHCSPAKPLPKDFEQFIQDSGGHGIIYFSLGSTFRAAMSDSVTKAFINVFKKLPQRIIWKVNDDLKNLPENIKTVKWCPQQDILGHNKTKLFITQGGMLSLQEAVYHGVPVLVIPILFDQPTNAKIADKVGYGRYLPLSKFSESVLEKEINEILMQPRYRMKAMEISNLMKDVPMLPGDKLRWWVDYVIRHKGYPIHRDNDGRYSWYNFLNIDIILFVQFCIIITLILGLFIARLLFKFLVKSQASCIKNTYKTKTS